MFLHTWVILKHFTVSLLPVKPKFIINFKSTKQLYALKYYDITIKQIDLYNLTVFIIQVHIKDVLRT